MTGATLSRRLTAQPQGRERGIGQKSPPRRSHLFRVEYVCRHKINDRDHKVTIILWNEGEQRRPSQAVTSDLT